MEKEILPYIIFLLIFIIINIILNFIIHLRVKEKVYSQLFYYWIAVLFILICEGMVTNGKIGLSLIFLSNFPAIFILARFILRPYSYHLKLNLYLKLIPLSAALVFIFDYFNMPFSITSLPIVLICIGPFVEAIYASIVLHKHKNESGFDEKIIGLLVAVLGISCVINYGLNRFNPTPTQYFIGFGSGFLCYLIYSILLPVYCIQQINYKRKDLLEAMVKEKTNKLLEAKLEKESLLAVLMHDISNPLMAATHNAKTAIKLQDFERFNKVINNLKSINDVIVHVREYECVLQGRRTLDMKEVNLHECLEEIRVLFEHRFLEKNIRMLIANNLPAETLIRVEKTSFIHSVVSNLISNALKFSYPNSEVLILCSRKNSEIIIQVVDHGQGMSTETLASIFDINAVNAIGSGTLGETGTGFGLSLVKAYAFAYGGKIHAISSCEGENRGTTFSIHLPTTSGNLLHDQTYLQ